MTTGAATLLALAVILAGIDWWAVARRQRPIEYVAKPGVMVALIAVAVATDASDDTVKTWFIVALAFSLAGDVFLMLEREQFLAGLASFLAAHLAYVTGLVAAGVTLVGLAIGAIVATAAIVTVGRRIGASVAVRQRRLLVPVWSYVGAISAMLAAAIGTGATPAIAGAVAFFVSDALLGWNRFVAPLPHGRLAIIVTYHLGQTLLVIALISL